MICHQTENRRFGWLVAYLLSNERDHERAQWAVTRNLPTDDPELAAVLMQASASQNLRVLRPAHHVVLEFAPADRVDRTLMERVADRLLAELGLGEHQAVFVAHHGKPHPHLHVMANRVHPETGRGWSTWHSWSRAREVLCELEKAFGFALLLRYSSCMPWRRTCDPMHAYSSWGTAATVPISMRAPSRLGGRDSSLLRNRRARRA